jgi:ferredoxin
MPHSLNLNIDYCGLCSGSCSICALSENERAYEAPFLSAAQMREAVRAAAKETGERVGHLVVGFGRGNTLALPPESIRDIVETLAEAQDAFSFDSAETEISTSLMGKHETHRDRAFAILDAIEAEKLRFDPRFVCVGNLAIVSEAYWKRILAFLDAMTERRGGGDGSGDVLLLNLPLGRLPPIEMIETFLGRLRSPVNVTWSPAYDDDAKNPAALAALETWLDEYHALAERLGMDSSLQTRAELAMRAGAAEEDEIGLQTETNASTVLFVDSKGKLHGGYSSVIADLDPIRFPTAAAGKRAGGSAMMSTPKEERATLLRHRACRACGYMPQCIRSGAHKAALMLVSSLSDAPNACPSGMRRLFARLKAEEDFHPAKNSGEKA